MTVLSDISFDKLQEKFEAAKKVKPPKKINIVFHYQVGGMSKQKKGWISSLGNNHTTKTNTICFEFADKAQVPFSHSKCTSINLVE
jgi:hypothetical protein